MRCLSLVPVLLRGLVGAALQSIAMGVRREVEREVERRRRAREGSPEDASRNGDGS